MKDIDRCASAAVTPVAERDSVALMAVAAEEELGPWLARHWGILADMPPELLALIDL